MTGRERKRERGLYGKITARSDSQEEMMRSVHINKSWHTRAHTHTVLGSSRKGYLDTLHQLDVSSNSSDESTEHYELQTYLLIILQHWGSSHMWWISPMKKYCDLFFTMNPSFPNLKQHRDNLCLCGCAWMSLFMSYVFFYNVAAATK